MDWIELVVWFVLLVVFVVVELSTVNLVSIWFAAGALSGLIAAAFGAEIWLQAVLFIVVSAIALAATRPLARRFLRTRRSATNADRVLDMTGIVEEEVNNLLGTGTVRAGGKVWTARSADGSYISPGTVVRPLRISGVKLIVEAVKQEQLQ